MIYDIADNPISSFNGTIAPSAVQVYPIKVDCLAGRYLKAFVTGSLTVEARKFGDVSWVDIEASPIDLTPYDEMKVEFEVQITAGAVTSLERSKAHIEVST